MRISDWSSDVCSSDLFLGTAAVIVLLLSLENSRRLMGQIEHVERPLSVLLELLAYLVPEYLAMGLLIALFLAVALAFRSMALKGELDILMSVGLSPWRLLRVPLLLGLLRSEEHTSELQSLMRNSYAVFCLKK